MSQPPSSAGSLVGQRLGKYELLALLALGGTAEIYLARIGGVAGFEKYVVVKCLHDHLADDAEFVRMFLDEARLGAQLEHSNIVQTLELGEQNRRYYMVMEYLAGMSLSLIARKSAERVPGGLMPVELTLGLLAQACSGLHYAHQRTGSNGQLLGIVHRDVSPQNLVISFEGMLKVVDFGIAKALQRETRTQSGTIKGKFAYMSPEQCRAGQVDHRTDIFALGIILHELLTGQRLFKRESPYDTYHAILAGKVPAPSTLNPGLDPALDELVLTALAPEADNRYATAEAFGDALTRMLHGRGHAVSPGVVSQFFDQYFSKEIAEHGQRMRELIEGRMAASVDEQWDDEAKSDVAMAASSSGEPKPIASMLLDGSASEPSVVDSELLEEAEEDEVVEEQDEDDGGGATRIELNPLEDAKLLHEQVTGQITLPEASLAGRRAATPVPPERASAHAPAGRRPAPASAQLPTSAPVSHGRPLADLPSPVEAVQRRSARAMSISSGVPKLSAADHSSARMARTCYLPAADGPAAADPPVPGSQRKPPSGRFAPVAMLDTQPGELLQERLGSGKFPSPDNLRTQIADPAAQPAGRASSRPAGRAPSQPAGRAPSQPADEARFPASANLRTQIADPLADPPANVSADSASMPIPSPSAAEAHALPEHLVQSGPVPVTLPEHLVQSGPVPVTLPDEASPSARADYAAGPNVADIPDMPAVARPMNTSAHMALTDRTRQKKPEMPQWLLAVIFVAAVGLSLGITVLLSKLL